MRVRPADLALVAPDPSKPSHRRSTGNYARCHLRMQASSVKKNLANSAIFYPTAALP